MGFEPRANSKLETVNEFVTRMKDTLEEAKSAIVKAKDDMARYYNQRRTPAPEYKPGDKVFVMSCDEMNANLVGKEHTNWSTDLHVVQDWYDAYSLQCHLSSEESLWIHDMTNHGPTNWKNQTHYDSYS
jgi:hypothetical protein